MWMCIMYTKFLSIVLSVGCPFPISPSPERPGERASLLSVVKSAIRDARK